MPAYPDRRADRRRHYFHWRVLVLVVLLIGAYTLHRLGQADDPRFYLFLLTPPGRLLARAFSWDHAIPPPERPEPSEKDMSPDELTVKYRWEKELAAEAPLHRLVLAGGTNLLGRLVSESAGAVVFQEAHGAGGLTSTFARDRVLRVDTLAQPSYTVTYRDVRFRMDYPDLRFHRSPPFTVACDVPYDDIRPAVEALREMHRQVLELFAPLVRRPQVRADIQVAFLSDEGAFQAVQRQYAPRIERSVGFYSVSADRLYILNMAGPRQRDYLKEQLDRAVEEHRRHAGEDVDEEALQKWRVEREGRILSDARRQTLLTVRHEGAHQLFHTCLIHSAHRAENDWLIEGLAVYCEGEAPGRPDPFRVAQLKAARSAKRRFTSNCG